MMTRMAIRLLESMEKEFGGGEIERLDQGRVIMQSEIVLQVSGSCAINFCIVLKGGRAVPVIRDLGIMVGDQVDL